MPFPQAGDRVFEARRGLPIVIKIMLGLLCAAMSLVHHRPMPLLQAPMRPAAQPASVLQLRGGAIEMNLGAAYAASLTANPIITKSLTAGAIFTLSDVVGQAIAPSPEGKDVKRTITSTLVGTFYFGPALHFWLEMISKILPGFDVKSTLLKTLLGQ